MRWNFEAKSNVTLDRTKLKSLSDTHKSIRARFAAVIWLIFPSVPHCCPLFIPKSAPLHCLHPPSKIHNLPFLCNSYPRLHLTALTDPDCSPFPELIRVTAPWQETHCHYGNDQSITARGINTVFVISESEICVGLLALSVIFIRVSHLIL